MSGDVAWGSRRWPMPSPEFWPVHVKRGPGQAICDAALPGEMLTRKAAEVTCPDCIGWAHA